MTTPSALLRMLRARAPWAIALCYALLLQAALAPAVSLARDPALPGSAAFVLCLSEQDGHGGLPAHHHDVDCCLPGARTVFTGPAILSGTPVAVPVAPAHPVGTLRVAAAPRAPPSVDLISRPARAPPVLAA